MPWHLEHPERILDCLVHEEDELVDDILEAITIWLDDPFEPQHPLVVVHPHRRQLGRWIANMPYGWTLTFSRQPARPPVFMKIVRAEGFLRLVGDP